jgi:peptidoglycan/LPS O-acetylase OafA/YrhL
MPLTRPVTQASSLPFPSSAGLPAYIPAPRSRDLPALTGLRFFLALWVILHHLTGPGQHLEPLARQLPLPLFTLIRGGYQAVTTFFVLSGFVLTRTYAATLWNRRSLLNYAIGRAARIYPVYLLALAVMIPFILEDRTPGKAGYVAAYATLTQAWLGPLPVGWNTPAWSLSCEMFFYALFPLSAILVRRANWRNVIAAAAVACVLTRVLWAAGVSDNIKPLVHLADFLMGVAAACAFDLVLRGKRPPAAWKLYVPGFAGAALILAFPALLPEFIDLNTALRPLNALLIVGLALGNAALSGRVLVYLGKSSYAMYILHVPVMWWYLRKSHTFSPALYIAIVIAISALVYGLFEEPANRWLRARLRRPAKP